MRSILLFGQQEQGYQFYITGIFVTVKHNSYFLILQNVNIYSEHRKNLKINYFKYLLIFKNNVVSYFLGPYNDKRCKL